MVKNERREVSKDIVSGIVICFRDPAPQTGIAAAKETMVEIDSGVFSI